MAKYFHSLFHVVYFIFLLNNRTTRNIMLLFIIIQVPVKEIYNELE